MTKSQTQNSEAALQLVLVAAPVSCQPRRWAIDDRTRELGRRGLAEARATLRAARARSLDRPTADAA